MTVATMDGQHTTEGVMKIFNWNAIIQSLVLIRLGQELGTESQVARAIHDLVAAILTVAR
jgi:hypothetical protein